MTALDILDNRLSYAIIFIFIYIYYFFHLITSITTEALVVFPNPVIFLLIFFTGIIIAIAMQEMNHQDVQYKYLLKVIIIGLIPSILVIIAIYHQIKKAKEENNDRLFILGLQLILVSILFVTVLYSLVIILTLFLTGSLQILYLPIHSSTGLLGFIFGYYLSRISDNPPTLISQVQEKILHPLLGSKKKRVLLALSLLFLTLFLALIDNHVNLQPITI